MWGWHVPAPTSSRCGPRPGTRSSTPRSSPHRTLFWWPVVRPWPSRPHWPGWSVPLYLLAGDLQNTVLAAILVFSDSVLYPTYAAAPRLFGLTALDDQALAGVLMWVPGSLAFLLPAAAAAWRLLSPAAADTCPVACARTCTRSPDVRSVPRGARLRSAARPARRRGSCARGSAGARCRPSSSRSRPSSSSTDSRAAGRRDEPRGRSVLDLRARRSRWSPCSWPATSSAWPVPSRSRARSASGSASATRAWPAALRSKWLAAGLLAVFFWAYEAFDLWDRPCATAGIVVAYFAAAFLVDALFRGASFCKYVCPIGQFQFVGLAGLAARGQGAAARRSAPAARRTTACAATPSGAAGLRARALPAAQGGQPRLHVLPRLREGVPARQRRDPSGPAGGGARAGSSPLLGRPVRAAARPGRPRARAPRRGVRGGGGDGFALRRERLLERAPRGGVLRRGARGGRHARRRRLGRRKSLGRRLRETSRRSSAARR